MNNNYLVVKSNFFIMNSRYDLSLEEQKIILTLASMVQPTDEEFKIYDFRISEFMNLLGVDTKTKYSEIPKITENLMQKIIKIPYEKGFIQTAWLSSVNYQTGEGMVKLRFSPELKPYMLKLNTMFTQYKLSNILSMKSKYSPRMYELLKCNEFKKQGFFEIDIVKLRELLMIENIYPRYYDFKRFVLEQSKKELESLTDIKFEFKEIKSGRSVSSLKFYITSNKPKNKKEVKRIKAKVIEEVSVTETESEEDRIYNEIIEIIQIICDEKVSLKNAKYFYGLASDHELGKINPLGFIEEVATYSKSQEVKGFIGWFKRMLVSYERPSKSNKQLTFNNFEGRGADYYGNSNLERQLLGWDKED